MAAKKKKSPKKKKIAAKKASPKRAAGKKSSAKKATAKKGTTKKGTTKKAGKKRGPTKGKGSATKASRQRADAESKPKKLRRPGAEEAVEPSAKRPKSAAAVRADKRRSSKPSKLAPAARASGKKVAAKRASTKQAVTKTAGGRAGTAKSRSKSVQAKGAAPGYSRGSAPRPRRKPSPRRAALKVTAAPAPEVEGDGKVRLNRYLASTGLCSRRAADEWIETGRISVDGQPVRELGIRVDPAAQEIAVDGQSVEPEKPVYVAFNKPKDVVCTNAKHEKRPRVLDYVGAIRGRVYTVGRLDADSEGLILLTNDGEFAQAIAHPRHGVPKIYAVLVRGRIEADAIKKAKGGVWLAEGRTGGAQIRVDRRSHDRSYLKVTLHEGKNREIRRVFAKLGHTVLSLKRVRIGELSLHGLKPGGYRFLRPEEVRKLLALARGEDTADDN